MKPIVTKMYCILAKEISDAPFWCCPSSISNPRITFVGRRKAIDSRSHEKAAHWLRANLQQRSDTFCPATLAVKESTISPETGAHPCFWRSSTRLFADQFCYWVHISDESSLLHKKSNGHTPMPPGKFDTLTGSRHFYGPIQKTAAVPRDMIYGYSLQWTV